MRRFIAGLSLFIAIAASAAAPDARRPSFVEESEQFRYDVLEDDQGGFYAVWTHQLADKTYNLIGQHVRADGTPMWDRPGIVLASLVPTVDDWDAFADGKVGLTLTWVQAGRTRAQRYNAEGQATWPSKASVTVSTMTQVLPTGVADASGGAYFVWSEQRYSNRWVLVSQHLNAQGAPVWTVDGTRVSLRPTDQRRPRVTYDGLGGAVIVWKDAREGASQVMAQRVDSQSNRLWAAEGVLITAPAGSDREFPLLAPVGDGGAAFGWLGGTSANRLTLQTLDAKGKPRWNPQGVTFSVGAWNEWNPTMVGNGRGQIWTAWEDYRNNTHWQAFVGNVDKNLHTTWPGNEVAVGPGLADQGRVHLVEDGRGGVFVSWVDNRRGQPGVYLQEISAQGRVLLGEEGRTIDFGLEDPLRPRLVNLSPGRAAIFYADKERKNRWALYWTAVTGPDLPAAPKPTPSKTDSGSKTPGPKFPEDDVPLPSGVGEGQR